MLSIPKTISGRQSIKSLTFKPEPSRIFEDGDNRYAEFIVEIPRNGTKINIRIEAELFQYDLNTAVRKGYAGFTPDLDLASYLKNEPMHEKDNFYIWMIAAYLPGKTDIEIVSSIYNYVAQNLTYDTTKYKRLGAVETARTKRGVCIDYCDLFVALCRARNIPTRVVYGLSTVFDMTPRHAWVEVYFENFGWIPFEPTHSPGLPQKWTFYYMPPVYFYISYGSTGLDIDQIHITEYSGIGFRQDQIDIVEVIEFYKPFHKIINSKDIIKQMESEGRIDKIDTPIK